MLNEAFGGLRVVERCNLLGVPPFSEASDMLYRPYLSYSHRMTIETVRAWMTEADMSCTLDPAGNLIGRFEGTIPASPALLIGSHLDSVRDAGRYDGPLGVMLGIECINVLGKNGRRFPFPIEIIAFGDEEGSRFSNAMMCSRSFAGVLDPTLLSTADVNGIPFSEALIQFGLEASKFCQAARPPGSIFAFLEAHIEQGPVLEAHNLPVGIVTGIASQLRYQAAVTGKAGHAGTTVMTLRKDALAAAAAMVSEIEKIGRSGPTDLVATVGRFVTYPNVINVIPGRVDFTIDVRAGAAMTRDRAALSIAESLRSIAAARGVELSLDQIQELPATLCNKKLIELACQATSEQGVSPFCLTSGAGHDAMIMAKLCPACMIFVRCRGGVSHNPSESVDPMDVQIALDTMCRMIELLGSHFERNGVALLDAKSNECGA